MAHPDFFQGGRAHPGLPVPSPMGATSPHPRQIESLGEHHKLPQRGPGRSFGKFGFWSILGPQKSRQNGQLAFESGGGQEVNLGGNPAPTGLLRSFNNTHTHGQRGSASL